MAKVGTFESKIYEWRNGRVIRTVETLTESYVTEDGGFMPQKVVATKVSELKPTDADWDYGIAFANELAAEAYLAQFE